MDIRFWLAVLLTLLTATNTAQGRTWTDASGKHTIEAELVGFQNGLVHLKKSDGTVIKVPLKNLCPADQQFVQQTGLSSGSSKTKTPEGGTIRVLFLGGTPFRVDSLASDGSARLSLHGLMPEGAVGPGFPFPLDMLVSMAEGYYLGLLGLPDWGAGMFPTMSSLGQELLRSKDLQVLSAQVVEVHKGASVTIRVAPEAVQRLKPGTRLVLVRPEGTSTAEMRQIPGLVPLVDD